MPLTRDECDLRLRRNGIFVAGSAAQYAPWEPARATHLVASLTKALADKEYYILTGFGCGIGEVVRRVLDAPNCCPNELPPPAASSDAWSQYRQHMLQMASASIFLFGNKVDATGRLVEASGMLEEFAIGLRKGVVPIPVGATGYTAAQLWHKVMADFDRYVKNPNLKSYYEQLGPDSEHTNEQLVDVILKLLAVLG